MDEGMLGYDEDMISEKKPIENIRIRFDRGHFIARIPADVLITTIESRNKLWYGSVDLEIKKVAGEIYHAQAEAERSKLHDLRTIIARNPDKNLTDRFNDVIFVVDNLRSPLDEVIYAGLAAAHGEKYKSVLLPPIRLNSHITGIVEKTPEEAVQRFYKGIKEFARCYGNRTSLEEITVATSDLERQYVLPLDIAFSHEG